MIMTIAPKKPATMNGWFTDGLNAVKSVLLPGGGGGSPTVNVAAPSTSWILPVAAMGVGAFLLVSLHKPSRR